LASRLGLPAIAGLVTIVFLIGSSVEAGIASAAPKSELNQYSQPVKQAAAELPEEYEGFDPDSSEVVDRDEFSNVYLNEDGTFTSEISLEPVNVPDGDDWVPASDQITHDSSGWAADDHPLTPVFATHADDAMTASHGGSEVTFTLEGADHSPIERVPGTDDAVQYVDAVEGAALRYDAQGASVKETIVLEEAPTETSWTWDISAPGLVFAKDELGDLEFTDGDGVVQFHIPAPVVWDSSGENEVREPALASLSTAIVADGEDYKLVLTADPLWLADPARVYPVFVDPTLAAGDSSFHAYKSDGATRTDAVHVGNSRDSNTNKYWRSQANYGYSSLSGKQVIDGSFKATYVSGTTSSYSGGIYVGTCHGYSGCYGDKLGTVTVGSGSTTVNDDRIAAQYAGWVDAGSYSHYLTSRGAETAGSYTYKQLNTSLSLTYKNFPSISGKDGASPADGGAASRTPELSVVPVDPSGQGVYVRYQVSSSSSFTSPLWTSDWFDPTSLMVPEGLLVPGSTYYWRGQVMDHYEGLYGVSTVRSSTVWSFHVENLAPSATVLIRATPALVDAQDVTVGLSPELGAWATDPEEDPLTGTFEIYDDDGLGGVGALYETCVGDAEAAGTDVTCATSTPLIDGQTYHIRARTSDGYVSGPWSDWQAVNASDAVEPELPEPTTAYIPFDHSVSLDDAADVMAGRDEDVVAYRFESEDLVGEWAPGDGETVADFLEEFDGEYDTEPEVVSVAVIPPEEANLRGGLGASRALLADPLLEEIETDKPTLVADPATGPAIVDFDEVTDAAFDQEDERVFTGLSTPQTTWGTLAAAPVGQLTSWKWGPSFAYGIVTKKKINSVKYVAVKMYFKWNGTDSSPTKIDSEFGAEFSVDFWGDYWTNDEHRCQVPSAIIDNSCLPTAPRCQDIDGSRRILTAYNQAPPDRPQGYYYAVYMKGAGVGDSAKNVKKLGAYRDTNDVWDNCNRNSITVGLRDPQQITKRGDGTYKLYTSVRAWHPDGGKKDFVWNVDTDTTDDLYADVTTISRTNCPTEDVANPNFTDCMGIPFPNGATWNPPNGQSSQTQTLLSRKSSLNGPNYCWTVHGHGESKPVQYFPCSGSW
jgi:hypothetical protein